MDASATLKRRADPAAPTSPRCQSDKFGLLGQRPNERFCILAWTLMDARCGLLPGYANPCSDNNGVARCKTRNSRSSRNGPPNTSKVPLPKPSWNRAQLSRQQPSNEAKPFLHSQRPSPTWIPSSMTMATSKRYWVSFMTKRSTRRSPT